MTTNRLLLLTILEGMYDMQDKIDKLRQQVQRQSDVTQSVVTVLNSISQQMRDAADDPQEIEELANQVGANADALAAAITAGTPAEADETGGATGATGGNE